MANFAASIHALSGVCPWLGKVPFPDGEVVLARDGSMTLRSSAGWAGACSVPRVAARQMLAAVQPSGPVACLLEPPHAQTILETLDRLGPDRAALALVNADTLAEICACADLSAPLAGHRLFVLTDAGQLPELYQLYPGLSVPSFFIRLSFVDETRASQLIAQVQAALGPVIQQHKAEGTRLRAVVAPAATGRLCVLGASRFRLWADGGRMLLDATAATSARPTVLDTDDPATATTHAILRAAHGCRAVVSADLWRHVLPDLLPPQMPWHVWLTAAAQLTDIPPFTLAGPHDQLWLPAESWQRSAARVGWPVSRTRLVAASMPGPCNPAGPLAIIGDTTPLTTPPDIEEYSSLRLLWEAIRDELLQTPQRLGGSAQSYLKARCSKLDLGEDQIDSQRLIAQLVAVAYQQGLARQLTAQGLPLAIWGRGWGSPEVQRFVALPAGVVRGEITDRQALAAAIAASRALVDWRVTSAPLLMETAGVPLMSLAEILRGSRPPAETTLVWAGLAEALAAV